MRVYSNDDYTSARSEAGTALPHKGRAPGPSRSANATLVESGLSDGLEPPAGTSTRGDGSSSFDSVLLDLTPVVDGSGPVPEPDYKFGGPWSQAAS